MRPIVLYNHACQKLGKFIEHFWRKCQEKYKNTFVGYLIPYNPGLRIFSENPLTQTMVPICLYTHAKNLEDL